MSAEYQTGPAEKPDGLSVTLDKETNIATLHVDATPPIDIELPLPQLEGFLTAVQDVWRIAKVANKQLGKVQTDLEDLI